MFNSMRCQTAGILLAKSGGQEESLISCSFEAGGFKFEGTPLEHQVLPEEWLRDWTRNLTTILSYLKVTSSLNFIKYCAVWCQVWTLSEPSRLYIVNDMLAHMTECLLWRHKSNASLQRSQIRGRAAKIPHARHLQMCSQFGT